MNRVLCTRRRKPPRSDSSFSRLSRQIRFLPNGSRNLSAGGGTEGDQGDRTSHAAVSHALSAGAMACRESVQSRGFMVSRLLVIKADGSPKPLSPTATHTRSLTSHRGALYDSTIIQNRRQMNRFLVPYALIIKILLNRSVQLRVGFLCRPCVIESLFIKIEKMP